jgi:hypothetical protein
MAIFWVVVLCSLVEVCQYFRGQRAVIALLMETARTSEMLVNFYQTTQCCNAEDCYLHPYCHEDLKSYIDDVIFMLVKDI